MKKFYHSFSVRRTPSLAVVFKLRALRHIVKPVTKRELKSQTFPEVSNYVTVVYMVVLKCRLIFADCIQQELKKKPVAGSLIIHLLRKVSQVITLIHSFISFFSGDDRPKENFCGLSIFKLCPFVFVR